MLKKRYQTMLLTFLCAWLAVNVQQSHPLNAETLPAVSTYAQAAALIDVTSGRILYSHNGNEQMLVASLTKIMTAVIALEEGDLTDIVHVGKSAHGKEGSSIYLNIDEEMSLEHLLYGLMMRSGNDAAVAIAEHVGGSEEGFVFLMNERARELGMTRTHFANPHGLDHPDHYSTANDMAKLTAYALKNEQFREIVKTRRKQVPNPNAPWDYTWYNKNKMLSLYDGADGVKTGYTKAAGRCLITSATKDGQQLAVVTLNDPVDWADHAKLFDYGFKHYPLFPLVELGKSYYEDAEVQAGDAAVAGTKFLYPLTEAEKQAISYEIRWENKQSLEQKLGLRGYVNIRLHDSEIGQVPLYAKDHPILKQSKHVDPVFHHKKRLERYMDNVMELLKGLFTWSI